MAVETPPASLSAPVDARPGAGTARWLLLLAVLTALSFAIYRGALDGPFIGDDEVYLVYNPYTASLDAQTVRAVLDPRSAATLHAVNYAPLYLLLCAAERQLFGTDVTGYHLVNVALHALNGVLFVALLLGSGVPRSWALTAGLVFTLHPANVEVVAWVSQLKTLAAFALATGALLCLWRRPGVASALFAAALLTKYLAVSTLLVAAAFAWARPERSREGRTWAWLGGWLALALLITLPQLDAFDYGGAVEIDAFADPWVHARTVAAIGARYLAMAAAGYGVAAYQEPAAALSWADPWWLAALPLGAILIWRLASSLRRRRQEAAYWVCAGASFVPISQIEPFFYGMADRYLYFILPGLLGGALLWADELRSALTARGAGAPARSLGSAVIVLGVALALFFGSVSARRATLWRSDDHLLVDAARRNPGGATAAYVRGVRAAQSGDPEGAVAALREAERLRHLSIVRMHTRDPRLAPLHGEQAFAEFVREYAGYRIELAQRRGYTSAAWQRSLASAHLVREEYDAAIAAMEAAVRAAGPEREQMLVELEAMRAARQAAGERGPGVDPTSAPAP